MKFLSFGSNLGDRSGIILKAVDLLKAEGVQILSFSSFYDTPPWGIENQGRFLNAVGQVDYPGEPLSLLKIALSLEMTLGRTRDRKWGPREIDIDLLEFDRISMTTPELNLPHPRYCQRAFVLLPFAEIAPGFVPSGGTKTISELLSYLPQQELDGIVKWQY